MGSENSRSSGSSGYGSGSSGSSGLLRNEGAFGDLNSPEIKKIYNLKRISASLITMPLSQNWDKPNLVLNNIHYIFIPFTPIYAKFTHLAIELELENNIYVVIEYGCYLSKNSNRNEFRNITEYRKGKNDGIIYYYPFLDGISFYVYTTDTLKKFDENYHGLIENHLKLKYPYITAARLKMLVKEYTYEYNIFNIYKNLCNITLEKSIYQLIYHSFRHQIREHNLEVENRITFNEFISNFRNGWRALDYNVLFHNCQDFAAKTIDIIKAYRKNERSRQLIFENHMPKNVLDKLKKNENENPSVSRDGWEKWRRFAENIPIVNWWYYLKLLKYDRDFKNKLSR